MKIALVTTSIHRPEVLALYRAHYAIDIFVIGDLKTPSCDDLNVRNLHYYSPDRQRELGYSCSELIGWNCTERRSIGFLEALKWGADIIVTTDDDNIPVDSSYFFDMKKALVVPFSGLMSSGKWFDVGRLLSPEASHRGFPFSVTDPISLTHVVDAKVGVAAGICLGDPDVSAITRIARAPVVHQVSEVLRGGVVVDPWETWTVFNSQNTAFVRHLAPAMFMWPGLGRNHDIFASLVCQRVMRDHRYVTHFGKPYVWQQRNKHDLVKDLREEMLDYEHLHEFSEWLNKLYLTSEMSPTEFIRYLCECAVRDLLWWPKQASEAGLAWADDCESVMS